MGRPYGSRTTIVICCALAILLGRLAVLQYRWATGVAAADAQREKEHLDSAASLFATEFNGIVAQAAAFLQNDASRAARSGERLTEVPKLIGELYSLDFPAEGAPKVKRLDAEGLFAASGRPEWMAISSCAPSAIAQPTALVVPIHDMGTVESGGPASAGVLTGTRVLKRFSRNVGRCFVARLDRTYLRDTLFPQLIHRSFGETVAGEYDFAVVSRNPSHDALYGVLVRTDLRKPFFLLSPDDLGLSRSHGPQPPVQAGLFVQQVETIVSQGLAGLFGPGIWELDIAHKDLPLAAVFERRRRRTLGMGLGIDTVLVVAIVSLVVATQRLQRLANRKMQFVAGVSHELRTPVAAIAMLSRNQADGLVVGAERVKQYGELIHQQSQRLNEMVEQTLQYAGILSDLRTSAKSAVDLGRLIQEAIHARQEDLTNAGFQVELALSPDLPAVFGDEKLLRTAVENLLSNAQKYAAGGHWIRVHTSYSAAQREVLISVEDRGAGIDPADQKEIFEPFSRGRAAVAAQIPGSGIGLSLVRSAVEAHRGSVELVSKPGRGSIFTMRLPV
jgi:two-component system, OmpR family, sensor histidine kinase SenX3